MKLYKQKNLVALVLTLLVCNLFTPLKAQKVFFEPEVRTLTGSSSGFNDGPIGSALFSGMSGIAIDGSGNLFVADKSNHRIRKISTNGVVSTVAGTNQPGYNGDGAALQTKFSNPFGIAIDNAGNLYVSDGTHRIRKISDGQVTTLAGSGAPGYANGIGINASFNTLRGLVVDGAGNVYVVDSGNSSIRKITPDGTVSTLASYAFSTPIGICLVGDVLYVADANNARIMKITADGVVSTFAGNGSQQSIDALTPLDASFAIPAGIAADATGNLYVTEIFVNNKVRKITPAGVVTTVAGLKNSGSTDGSGTSASFNFPNALAINSSGVIYVADTDNNRIREIIADLKFNTAPGVPSAELSFFVNGANLTSDVTISAPVNYDLSLTSGTGFASSINIDKDEINDGLPLKVYVRLSASAQAGTHNGNISLSSPGAVTQTLPVTGVVNGLLSKADQTIVFGSISDKVLGAPAFAISATASSGLPVTLTALSDHISIAGSQVTLLKAGKARIAASQAGDNNYNAATVVERSFCVNPAKPTISASLANADALVLTSSASSGNRWYLNDVAISQATNTTHTVTAAGVYQVQSVADECVSELSDKYTVLAQTITFTAISDKVFGAPVFAASATSSSGLPVTLTAMSDNVSITGAQVTLLKAGKARITASQAGDKNYNAAASVERTFCVNPAKPSITASFANSDAPVLTSSASSGNRWYLNNVAISQATNNTYTVKAAGVYQVQSVAGECVSELSDKYAVVVTGDLAKIDNGIKAYPNPTVDFVTIEVTDASSFRLTNVSGVEQSVEYSQANGGVKLDVRHLAPGMYIIRAAGKDGNQQIKFIKK